jgi:hypothetical protein
VPVWPTKPFRIGSPEANRSIPWTHADPSQK